MGTVIKHPVPDRVKLSFVIFDIRALWCSGLSVRVPGCQKLQITAWPGLAQDALWLYPYGNSGRQRVDERPTLSKDLHVGDGVDFGLALWALLKLLHQLLYVAADLAEIQIQILTDRRSQSLSDQWVVQLNTLQVITASHQPISWPVQNKPAFSANHTADIDKTKYNYNYKECAKKH